MRDTRVLPDGVLHEELKGHPDDRGRFTEIFRQEWGLGIEPVQWNVVSSAARVLRGVHVHRTHADYLILLSGRASIGLCDLRDDSPTAGFSELVELSGERLEFLAIPPGVAHGFYFREASQHLYAVSHYFDPSDELGCHWADPGLRISWPDPAPILSEKDRTAGSLLALRRHLATPRQARG